MAAFEGMDEDAITEALEAAEGANDGARVVGLLGAAAKLDDGESVCEAVADVLLRLAHSPLLQRRTLPPRSRREALERKQALALYYALAQLLVPRTSPTRSTTRRASPLEMIHLHALGRDRDPLGRDERPHVVRH